jgi:hypothetical protein
LRAIVALQTALIVHRHGLEQAEDAPRRGVTFDDDLLTIGIVAKFTNNVGFPIVRMIARVCRIEEAMRYG